MISRRICTIVLLVVVLAAGCGPRVLPPPPPPPPPPASNRPPSVNVACDPCDPRPGQPVQLAASAQDPDGDALVFSWTAPGAEFFEPRGPGATWVAPRGGPFQITVRVDDGKGGTATDTITVNAIDEPLATAGPDDEPKQFPWPPPQWTTRVRLGAPLGWQATDKTYQTAFERVKRAVDAAGFPEWSVYPLADGFALVAQMESIRPDGTPLDPPRRWLENPPLELSDGLAAIIRRLATAEVGRYRLIVLVLTTMEVRAGFGKPDVIKDLPTSGPQELPAETAERQPPKPPTLTALVYEFMKKAGRDPFWLDSGSSGIDARQHLRLAGIR